MHSIQAPVRFADLYTPKLVTILREGYRTADLRADALAGLTVAIVALPLSMAIAVASGVGPDQGLYAAIIGGFFVSALGGSRFQIGGPAGAFIGLVAATVAQHGLSGLILATFLSGLMLLAIGLLRLGTFIKYIPYPVTVGFTAGIAVIIFASQLKELLGVPLAHEPVELLPKLEAIGAVIGQVNPSALAIAVATIGIIVLVRHFRPRWPSYLIGVGIAAILVWAMGLEVTTIGSRFGGIASGLLAPRLPDLSPKAIIDVLPAALAFTLLGAIESLLSAVVADSMSGRRHRSNCELVAQGVANIASALFGGIPVTGTIARTATNVRAGARGPLAGMFHAIFLLLFMMVAAPLASMIPLAALGGVLAVVAWGMAEKHEFLTLLRASRGEALVLLVTFLLVVFRDLSEGILIGFALASLLFLHRMAGSIGVEKIDGMEDVPDATRARLPYDVARATDREVMVFKISGAFFFGSAAAVATALDRIGEHPKAYVLDFSGSTAIDSTGAVTIASFADKARKAGAAVHIVGAPPSVRRVLLSHGLRPPLVAYETDIEDAMERAH